jgi:hypothetical protein
MSWLIMRYLKKEQRLAQYLTTGINIADFGRQAKVI